MSLSISLRKLAPALAAALFALAAGPARAQDDTALFSTAVAPNVMLLVDSSGSMNEIMWHPNYVRSHPTACPIFNFVPPNSGSPPSSAGGGTMNNLSYTCDPAYASCRFTITSGTSGFTPTSTVSCPAGGTRQSGYVTRTFCGRTRKMYVDGAAACDGNGTRWSEEYVEWYFSSDADQYWLNNEANTSTDISKVDANRNGVHYINNTQFPLYKRTRIIAAREIARDVIYQINSNCGLGGGFPCPAGSSERVRFGVAAFDETAGAPGGYVRAAIDNYSANATLLDSAITALEGNAWTPLAESLFKTYTYFMSRNTSNLPFGFNGTTRFPKYSYQLSDGAYTISPPGDPLKCPPGNEPCACQKNFVIVITDGAPTFDDFVISGTGNSNTAGRTLGFADFIPRLVGNFNADGEVEQPAGSNGWLYLDDLAKFMATQDFRPDLDGTQTIDIYTVGFATGGDPVANTLLSKTADVGNGLFFTGTQAQELTDALVKSIQSIILKSQSFTAATVPATRTSSGGKFYNSLFVPSLDSGYWEGHLQSWTITEAGEILDSLGGCAFIGDPVPCTQGTLDPNATPWWDAGNAVPAPGSRNLITSVNSTPTLFNTATMDETLLNLAAGDAALYDYTPPSVAPGTLATLADMVVMNVRGCQFGTGVGAVPCVTRVNGAGSPHLLGDIFHSNPVVVGSPRGALPEQSYRDFASPTDNPVVGLRDQVMVAGANDGVFRVFDAGSWVDPDGTGPLPAGYDPGTGGEVAGFLPYTARQNVKQLARDDGARDYYFTDGSPVVSDAWFYDSPTASLPTDKNKDQWHTVAVAGMRQGGNQYFALDITNPAAANYPGYLWEFPREGAASSVTQWMGQSWSEPIIARVRLAVDGDLLNPQERWVAIFAGGYAESGDPNKPLYDLHATAGRSITMLDLKTGEIVAQKTFQDTSAPAETDPTTIVYDPLAPEASMAFAMASTPGVFDLDADGYADLVYVGDLGGNLWKWVVSSVGHDPVNSAGLPDTSQPAWHFEKFFAAPVHVHSGTGQKHYKSFFFYPSATLKSGDLWLAFGSGERADLQFAGYPAPEDENNRFYAVKDLDPRANSPSGVPMDEANLLDITGDASCADVASFDGYYFKGVDGEKFVTASDIFFYYVFVASFVPTTSTDPCEAAGEASLYAFKVYCGEGLFDDGTGDPVLSIDLGDGMPTDPKVSLSGSQSQVFINKKDEVMAPPVPFKLDEAGGTAVWSERHED